CATLLDGGCAPLRPMSRSHAPPTSRSKRPPSADAAPRLRSRPPAVDAAERRRAERDRDRDRRPSSLPSFERGARVSVLKGPFAGKVGVVQELDGKGGARVMLGLLPVRLDLKNL